ncbi:MAG: hypothetical protein HFG41_03460 [Coprococcus sp.]|nr:hypothetical protein [Coprococcus sp.]
METIKIKREGNLIVLGESPQLIVDLQTQRNFIKTHEEAIPYRRKVEFSDDLLAGKRKQVMDTAVRYYYRQACEVVEGIKVAGAYRAKINTTVREVK